MRKLGDATLRLLRNVRGTDLVELHASEECSGFGGTFAIKNADVSTAKISDKMCHVNCTGAGVCTAVDSSGLMHICVVHSIGRGGVDVVHLAEILDSTE